jgi:hypothetical protein
MSPFWWVVIVAVALVVIPLAFLLIGAIRGMN